jgi:hypothetical protein
MCSVVLASAYCCPIKREEEQKEGIQRILASASSLLLKRAEEEAGIAENEDAVVLRWRGAG